MTLDRCPDVPRPSRFDPARTVADRTILCPPVVREADKLVGYLRTGGCTVGCGTCCEAIILPLALSLHRPSLCVGPYAGSTRMAITVGLSMSADDGEAYRDWERWLRLHDVQLAYVGGSLLANMSILREVQHPPSFFPDLSWLETQGASIIRRGAGRCAVHIPLRCAALGENGLCELYGAADRPKMCGRYPRHPLDIEGLRFCTYNFHPIERIHRTVNGEREAGDE